MRLIHYFDLETTGVDTKTDRPVQVGLTIVDRILMNSFCDPCMPVDPGAAKVTGISNDTVQGHPDYIMALWAFFKLLMPPNSAIICGFNSTQFDTPMVDTCMRLNPGCRIAGVYDQLDVLDLLYRYEPTMQSKKLSAAHLELTGKELVGAHGAVQDCLGTKAILAALCEKHGKTTEEFTEELKTPKRYEIMPIGKYSGDLVTAVPRSWAQWMRNNASDMRPDLQLTIDWILDEREPVGRLMPEPR
jgi:DNA polymerase III epsilon subunit-like protein